MSREEEKLPTRTKEWWEHQHVSWANNRTAQCRLKWQFRATALFSVNRATHRVTSKGSDESQLGRLVWTRYNGKGNQTLSIISAYRPNPPNGPYTVYAQQNAYFNSMDRNICPRIAFVDDLSSQITLMMEQGDHVIVLIDGNSNMKAGNMSITLQALTLREVILERHGTEGPATYKRNSPSLQSTVYGRCKESRLQEAFFQYDEVFPNTHHRCLWVDLTYEMAFGHNMAPLSKKKARKLHCKDPRIVDNFNSLFCEYPETHKLFERVIKLDQKKFVSRRATITEYEELDALRCKAAAFAEAKCRKLRKGNVAFSPELNMARMTIRAWTLVVKKVQGKRVSSRLLSRALKKANLKADARALTAQESQQKLKEAYRNYYLLKGQAAELCQMALETLAEAIAERGSSTQARTLKLLREREKQRAMAKKIRCIQGKFRTGSTTMVTTSDNEGKKIDLTKQKDIERAILDNNLNKFLQSKNTPFYLPH
jgi:hypothetical protein